MLEEITVNAAQMLTQLFWLFLILIFVWGVAWSKTKPNPKHD